MLPLVRAANWFFLSFFSAVAKNCSLLKKEKCHSVLHKSVCPFVRLSAFTAAAQLSIEISSCTSLHSAQYA